MFKLLLSVSLFAVTLTACSNRYALEGRGPDEYTVLSKPPLSLPPDFTLRAPEPQKKATASQTSTSQQAKEALTGKTQTTKKDESKLTAGENALLKNTKEDENIRNELQNDGEADDDALYLEKKIQEWQGETDEILDADTAAEELKEQGVKTTGNPLKK